MKFYGQSTFYLKIYSIILLITKYFHNYKNVP